MSVEDIVLSHDRRGISALRNYLPADFCHQAAALVLETRREYRRPVIITTGFYVLRAGAPETDGPPGALAVGRALNALDFDVVYVTDRYALPLFSAGIVEKASLIDFPVADHDASRRFARQVLADVQPALLVAVERPGLNGSHMYLNMAGEDISEYTAKIDYLFLDQSNSLGIGDGGNEIGMGNLAQHIRRAGTLSQDPALTPVNRLVIAAVSNWGAYGLVAALSRLVKRNLLPSVHWEKEIVREIVARGAVDGVSGRRRSSVDSFDLEQNSWALSELHGVLADMP